MTTPVERNLFVALSPLQIICAREARENFCQGEQNHLVVIHRFSKTSKDYRHKLREVGEGWWKVTHLRETKRRGLARVFIRLWNTAYISVRHRCGSGKVFLGDPYIKWLAMLGFVFGDEVVWLDDGAASINILNKFTKSGKLCRPNKRTPKFFTIFASDQIIAKTNGAVVQNKLTTLRASQRADQRQKPQKALFIGQWLSERAGVAQEAELDNLFRFAKRLEGWDLIYAPHRHESAKKLALIAQHIKVVQFEDTIERTLLQAEVLPTLIASWYSSAIFTLARLYPEICYQSLQVPLNEATDQQITEWMCVYEAMKHIGVELIDLTMHD